MAGKAITKKTEKIEQDLVVEQDLSTEVDTQDLLRKIEELQKQLDQSKKEEKSEAKKIPDDLEIEIEVGLNSSLSFFDEKGRIFYNAEFDGMGNTDTISLAELKKIRSASGKSKYLTRGFFLIKGDPSGEYTFEQVIKELRLTPYYSGKLNFGNMEEVMVKGSAKTFVDGINEIKDKKSEMLYVMVDKFKSLYDQGLIKDVDKVNQMKYIVKKENGNVDLFD